MRYKLSGLRKRAEWESVWERQRAETTAAGEPMASGSRDAISPPPTYAAADFVKPSHWRQRGSFDMPNERFISCGTTYGTLPEIYGWAGWDHRQQADALAAYGSQTQIDRAQIVPLPAGALRRV